MAMGLMREKVKGRVVRSLMTGGMISCEMLEVTSQ